MDYSIFDVIFKPGVADQSNLSKLNQSDYHPPIETSQKIVQYVAHEGETFLLRAEPTSYMVTRFASNDAVIITPESELLQKNRSIFKEALTGLTKPFESYEYVLKLGENQVEKWFNAHQAARKIFTRVTGMPVRLFESKPPSRKTMNLHFNDPGENHRFIDPEVLYGVRNFKAKFSWDFDALVMVRPGAKMETLPQMDGSIPFDGFAVASFANSWAAGNDIFLCFEESQVYGKPSKVVCVVVNGARVATAALSVSAMSRVTA